MISVVVPIFNEEKTVKELHQRIIDALKKQSEVYEVIFVNDGSTDGTEKEAASLRPLKLISLQRNYGETPALDVGVQATLGDIIIFLDADLQNDPEDILALLEPLSRGYDVAVGWRKNRKDGTVRLLFSALANSVTRFFLNVDIHDHGCGLKVYKSKFIKDFRLWGAAQVFLPAVAKERGARIIEVPVTHSRRSEGYSKINMWKAIKAIFDLVSVAFFVKYFSAPLRFFGGWGLSSMVFSFVLFGAAVILKVRGMEDFSTTPLPIIGSLFTILGVILFMIGFLAEMMLRFYSRMGGSPLYTIRNIHENT